MKPHGLINSCKILVSSAALLAVAAVVSVPAHAASVTGTMTLSGGDYSLTGGANFSNATGIDFASSTITAADASDILGTTVSFGNTGTVQDFTFDPLSGPLAGFVEIGGWSFQLDTAQAVTPRSTSALFIVGTGVLSGNGYDPTPALWSFSSVIANDYSMTITAVPVPAAMWLFGSGLLGLAGIARRRTGTQ